MTLFRLQSRLQRECLISEALQRVSKPGRAPSGLRENSGKISLCEVPVPIFSQRQRVGHLFPLETLGPSGLLVRTPILPGPMAQDRSVFAMQELRFGPVEFPSFPGEPTASAVRVLDVCNSADALRKPQRILLEKRFFPARVRQGLHLHG